MGVRHWLMMMAMVIGAALLLAACTSPGKPFAYLDVKVSVGPTATPAQPVIGQATTIRFTVRNTWNQPLDGITWELRETTGGPVSPLASGTTNLLAYGNSAHEFVITSPTKGTHTYEVVVAPPVGVIEDDATNNTSSTLTVLVADQDITFGTGIAAPVVEPGADPEDDPQTLTFTITNTVNSAQTSPASSVDVPFDILRNGVAITPPYTATPASPAPVAAQSGATPGSTSISVELPATNSAGTFVYTISLWPNDDSNGDDSNTNNNSVSVTLVIPANN